MNVLIIGSGGREHALAWKCAQSPKVEQVFVAPGNGGTAAEPKVRNLDVSTSDIKQLACFAKQNNVDLTIVGPEAPLVAGIVDDFQSLGLPCFGPSRAAARLEGSKSFSKDFMRRHGIPTAAYEVFTEVGPAAAFARECGAPIVIKADGLAAGKGVIVAQTEAEAIAAIEDMLAGNRFGQAGHRVVIEQFLAGEEASFIVMSDGANVLPMATSQDHKARDDGDKGPNTGGMGAYSPAPVVTAEIHDRIMEQVIRPTIAGMAADGHPYVGFLYAGLMIAPDGAVNVVEFNCRFGDPEAQPIMMRLRGAKRKCAATEPPGNVGMEEEKQQHGITEPSQNAGVDEESPNLGLADLCSAALSGELDTLEPIWDPRSCLGVVLAAGGYPGSYAKGTPIFGLDRDPGEGRKVFHAGTAREPASASNEADIIRTNGGRVLCATALGEDIAAAQSAAYELTRGIHWKGVQYRTDIGHRAVRKLQLC